MDETCLERVCAAVSARCRELRVIVHAVGGTQDHLHLVISIPLSIAISRVIGQAKGSSAHLVNSILDPGAGFAWQPSYGIVSFRESELSRVVAYVRNQREHHADRSLWRDFERRSG